MAKKKIKIFEKHSVITRWTHWIHFPVLALMCWSGILIYWANRAYWPHFSDSLYKNLHLDHRLAEGLSYHFLFMWPFALNGILYFTHLLVTGEWRELFPKKQTFREAGQVILHDLGISKTPLPRSKFNGAQRLAYTGVNVMAMGSILTGVAIYKPVQISWLTFLLGGYEIARMIHYWLMVGYILFFIVHVMQVIRAGWNNFRSMVAGFEIPKTE